MPVAFGDGSEIELAVTMIESVMNPERIKDLVVAENFRMGIQHGAKHVAPGARRRDDHETNRFRLQGRNGSFGGGRTTEQHPLPEAFRAHRRRYLGYNGTYRTNGGIGAAASNISRHCIGNTLLEKGSDQSRPALHQHGTHSVPPKGFERLR
jgi:hypothetical protein